MRRGKKKMQDMRVNCNARVVVVIAAELVRMSLVRMVSMRQR